MDGLGCVGLGLQMLLLAPCAAAELDRRSPPALWVAALGLSGLIYTAIRSGTLLGGALGAAQVAAAGAVLILLHKLGNRTSHTRIGGDEAKLLLASAAWVGLGGLVAVLVAATVLVVGAARLRGGPAAGALSAERPFGLAISVSLLGVTAVLECLR